MRFGTIAIVGRSNVGKSTFLNRVLGEPLAIVSPLPQTTRDNVLGVVHRKDAQLAFLDTPGVHQPRSELGRRMNASALDAARTADVVLFMTDISALTPPKKSAKEKSVQELDFELFATVPADAVAVLAVNKVDALRDKSKLLPVLVAYQEKRNFAALVPISVQADDGIEIVLGALAAALPEGGLGFDEDTLTDRPTSFFVREYIREQVLLAMRGEIPHAVAVSIDEFAEGPKSSAIKATVHVEKVGQRKIIIGTGGLQIKGIRVGAQKRIAELLGHKVHLELFVRVTPQWKSMPRQLAELGYEAPVGLAKVEAAKKPTRSKNQKALPAEGEMTPTQIVAVVGRPNVGKSTLFNRLVGKKLAIVDDQPGVTRDRHYAPAHIHGHNVTLVDTGGFDPTSDDPMQQGIARHVDAAVAEADVIVCVLDGSMSPTGPDREAIKLLRRAKKPVIYVANKVDTARHMPAANELYELGIPEIIAVSALHGRGTADLALAIAKHLPKLPKLKRGESEEPEEPDEITPRIAFIGRPNAGKSSMFNRLTGSERALVDSRPGTTRDPVDARIESEGRSFLLVDTAGIRKKARVERGVELIASLQAIRSIERAQVIILMCDATTGVHEQDARLLGMCLEKRRAVIVGLNKSDLQKKGEQEQSEEKAREELRFAGWVPMVHLSAKTGRGVKELLDLAARASKEFKRRIPTGELNRFFENVLTKHPPPTSHGRAPRIFYVTQAEAHPPVFVAMCNAPEYIKESYKRFVANQIRKAFDFRAVPISVEYRARKRNENAPPGMRSRSERK